MKILNTFAGGFVVMTISSTCFAAYFQADLPAGTVNTAMGTHIVISGKGLEVGDQWLRVAHTQALVFKDRKDHGSIRLIGAIENSDTLGRLAQWGYQNIQVFNKTMTGSRVVGLLQNSSKIGSIDMIGHNGAVLGFVLEDYDNRFFMDDAAALAPLASKMTKDAFVRILGCNTGWKLAPAVAKSLKVPVSGTFTFADIQKLHELKDWFYNDEGRYPDGKFLRRNEVSFKTAVDCQADGGCLRLKTVHINYQGKHGTYAGTVPFLKFFCGPLDQSECSRRMALSVQFLVSTVSEIRTADDYNHVLADYFCPGYKSVDKRSECRQKILNHLKGTQMLSSTFSTADGPTVSCDMFKCSVRTNCDSGSCVMEGTGDLDHSTTYVNELNIYKAGFKLISGQ